MIEPTIEKIIIEKTPSGINLEFQFEDKRTHILTDLNKVEMKCENIKNLLTEFSVRFDSSNIPKGEVLKAVSKLLNK